MQITRKIWLRTLVIPVLILVSPVHAQKCDKAPLDVIDSRPYQIYADPLAKGEADGTSWQDAYTSIQDAVAALTPGDTLHSRGDFHESVLKWNVSDWTWIGSSDPSRPRFIRGDRYFENWVQQGEMFIVSCDFNPTAVVYDYQRDHYGRTTGVPGSFFGHLFRVTSIEQCAVSDGSWFYHFSKQELYVNPPGQNPQKELIGACVDGNGVTLNFGNNVTLNGVNTMLWCRFRGASGYGLRANGLTDSTFENAELIDSGWHAAGFVGVDSARNTMRNLVARGQATNGIAKSIAYVFYSQVDRPESQCLAESLVFHAHPPFRHDGYPLHTTFRPMLGASHTNGEVTLGGIDWIRVTQIDYEREISEIMGRGLIWQSYFIGANNTPTIADPEKFDSYYVRVIDSTAKTSSVSVSNSIAYDRTRFLHREGALSSTQSANTLSENTGSYLRACNIVFTPGPNPNTRLFRLSHTARLTLEACTIVVDTEPDAGVNAGTFFRLDSPSVRLVARHCIFYRTAPGTFFANSSAISVENAETVLDFNPNIFYGFDENRFWIGSTGGNSEWWMKDITPIELGSMYIDPMLVVNSIGEMVPRPGSVALTSRWISHSALDFGTLSGNVFSNSYGSHQSCAADSNGDGMVDLSDLDAILSVFGTAMLPADGIAGDTNGDGTVDLEDLDAVLAAFGTDCP